MRGEAFKKERYLHTRGRYKIIVERVRDRWMLGRSATYILEGKSIQTSKGENEEKGRYIHAESYFKVIVCNMRKEVQVVTN